MELGQHLEASACLTLGNPYSSPTGGGGSHSLYSLEKTQDSMTII